MGQGEKHTSKARLVNARKAFGSEVVLLQMRNRLPIKCSQFLHRSDEALVR
jgi:hypothetical protein